jgi:hypothetical protein
VLSCYDSKIVDKWERQGADGTRDILGLWIENTEGAKVLDEGVHR